MKCLHLNNYMYGHFKIISNVCLSYRSLAQDNCHCMNIFYCLTLWVNCFKILSETIELFQVYMLPYIRCLFSIYSISNLVIWCRGHIFGLDCPCDTSDHRQMTTVDRYNFTKTSIWNVLFCFCFLIRAG